MLVRDVMSKKLVAVKPGAPFEELWKAIFKKHINAILVLDAQNKLAGIVTKEDLLKLLYPEYSEVLTDLATASDFESMEEKIHDLASVAVDEIMCKKVIFTRDETQALRALSRIDLFRNRCCVMLVG